MSEIVISILVLIGGFLSLLSSIGLIRFRDVYGRAQAATKSATLGVISIMLGVFLFFLAQGQFNAKILLAILFVFLTAPVAAMMISRTAYWKGVPLWEKSIQDDLKEVYDKKNENDESS